MSQVTCLAIGDPHFQVSNVPDAEDLIKKANQLVEQLAPTFVVILGDLLHTHEKIHVIPFNLATRLITSLARKVQVFLIIGNHDLLNNQQVLTNKHAFNSFKKINNVAVCDKVVIRNIGGHKFVFCPYVPPGRFEKALDSVEDSGKCWDDADCIFAHQEFYGCRFNPVMTSTEGDIWPDEYPMVVSGHIHDAQRLQKNIYYVGSSMQHAFGESADKTVALLSFDPFTIQKIDLELRKRRIVYLDIENVDKFKAPGDRELVKLTLQGSTEQFRVFRKGKRFKELQQLGIAVSFSCNTAPIVGVGGDGGGDDDGDGGDGGGRGRQVEKRNIIDILEELIVEENDYVKAAFDDLTGRGV